MDTANGLARRVDALERAAGDRGRVRDLVGEALVARIFEQAERIRNRPAGPIELQPPVERCIRAALIEAEGAEGAAFVWRFWAAFTARSRAFLREHGQ